MEEWVLLLALNVASGVPGEIRDVSFTTVSGFSSKATCEAAAQTIAERAIGVVGRARGQAGIQMSSSKSMPGLNSECIRITK